MSKLFHNYFVYITTNPARTVFYVGVTNNLQSRIYQHYENRGKPDTFAGKYYCYKLVYFEHFINIEEAIAREKEIKLMNRARKLELIRLQNPKMLFLKPK